MGADYAVYGGRITFAPSGGKTVTLSPFSGIPETAYGVLFKEKAVLAYSVYLNECNTSPSGLTANDTTIVAGTTPWIQQVVITGWQKYNLYVNGTQVNENNKDNLTSLLGSNATGTLKYDPNTQTLTMNNLKAAPSSYDTKGTLINAHYYPLTIAVEGENEITAPSGSTFIYSQTNLTVTKGSTSTRKLTLKGSPKWFVKAGTPTIKNVTLYIDGQAQDGGIINTSDTGTGTISNATVSIKSGTTPLSGSWNTSGVYGVIQGSDQDITFNPSTKELVYCDDYGPTTIPVTEDITIYPTPDYTLTISGNKPQSYTSADGVCFDEFSRRLYLRNIRGTGSIVANIVKMKIHTIGDCAIWSSDCPLTVTPEILIFQGPGTLSLTSYNDCAAHIIRRSAISSNGSTVQVNNTKLKLKGKTAGMVYSSSTSLLGTLSVTGSRVEANCEGISLFGFSNLAYNNCILQTPQGGYYANNCLYNADGTAAMSFIILPEAPEEITFDAHSDNDSYIFSNYGKEGIVTIKNLTIKGNGTWRTICLPFNVKRIGSVLQNCEIRECNSSLNRQQGKVEILDFTTNVLEMKANVPYIIRNTSGTDIVNPNFGFVKLEGSRQNVYLGISLGGNSSRRFAGSYAQREETNVHVLEEGNMELVHRDRYTADAFEALFSFGGDTDYKVVYTGSSENDLIDGIETVDAEPAGGAVYDLSGRKYDALPNKSGIYIKNGKKVIVK